MTTAVFSPYSRSGSPDTKAVVKEALKELLGLGDGSEVGYKHDASGTPSSVGFVHGPSSLLNYPGVDPTVFSTIVGHLGGVQALIPARPSVYLNPTYTVITGIKDGSGDEPAGLCDEAPIGGIMKAGTVTAPFGRYARQTREIHPSQLGRLMDRAEPLDLTLANRWDGSGPFGTSYGPMGNILVNELDVVMMERAVAFYRLLSRQVWEGDPTNSVPPGYEEFAGLDVLVNTTWRDALTGIDLPSLRPNIKDFGSKRIDEGDNGSDLVNAVTYTCRYLEDLADRSNITPVTWVIAMRKTMFYELTKLWPCSYFTTLCELPDSGVYRQNIDLGDQIRMRDEMRAGQYLVVDGKRWTVVLDDAIPEVESSAGCFKSDIYWLPLRATGRQVLYFEYFDYGNSQIQGLQSNPMFLGFATNGGAFFETPAEKRGCISYQAEIKPRLVLRTPWLAARIQNVVYCPLEMPRQPYPDDPYHVNGGATYTVHRGESYYNPWQSD